MRTGVIVITVLLALAVPALAATSPTGKSAAEIRASTGSGDWNRAVKKQADKAKAYIAKRTKGEARAEEAGAGARHRRDEPQQLPVPERQGRPSLRGRQLRQLRDGVQGPRDQAGAVRASSARRPRTWRSSSSPARPEPIRDGTLDNLKAAGFKGKYDLVLQPPSRAGDASMVPYKSGARQQVEKRGYKILANLGDQRSDLKGGYSERTYKLPNVIYRTP